MNVQFLTCVIIYVVIFLRAPLVTSLSIVEDGEIHPKMGVAIRKARKQQKWKLAPETVDLFTATRSIHIYFWMQFRTLLADQKATVLRLLEKRTIHLQSSATPWTFCLKAGKRVKSTTTSLNGVTKSWIDRQVRESSEDLRTETPSARYIWFEMMTSFRLKIFATWERGYSKDNIISC